MVKPMLPLVNHAVGLAFGVFFAAKLQLTWVPVICWVGKQPIFLQAFISALPTHGRNLHFWVRSDLMLLEKSRDSSGCLLHCCKLSVPGKADYALIHCEVFNVLWQLLAETIPNIIRLCCSTWATVLIGLILMECCALNFWSWNNISLFSMQAKRSNVLLSVIVGHLLFKASLSTSPVLRALIHVFVAV